MRITKKTIQTAWILSIVVASAVFLAGATLTFPNRPVRIMSNSPIIIENFYNASDWTLVTNQGIPANQSGMEVLPKDYPYPYPHQAHIWLKLNGSTPVSLSYSAPLSLHPRKFPVMVLSMAAPNSTVFSFYVSDKKNEYTVLTTPGSEEKQTYTIDLRHYTNSTISQMRFEVTNNPSTPSQSWTSLYIDQIVARKIMVTMTWDYFAVLAIGTLFPAPTIVYFIDSRRKQAVDNHIPDLMRDIAEAGRTGMTIARAIEVSGERDYGPLTEEVHKLVAQLSWRVPLSRALQDFADRINTPLARRASMLILEASKTGGDVQQSLETVNASISAIQHLEKRRKAEMRPYIAVIYIAFAVFLITTVILITQFFSSLADTGVSGFVVSQVSVDDYTKIFLYMGIIQALLGGLVGGKMSSGELRQGLKHCVLLISICFVTFTFFV